MAAGRFAALRRAGSFLALLASEVGAVALLSRLGQVPALRIPWHHLGPWLLNSPLQDVLGAILRMVALVVAWWLLSSNLLYLLASISRIPGAVLAVRWCTLPVVRRVTDHAIALTLATSIMGAGTAAVIANATPAAAAVPRKPGPIAASATPAQATGGYVPHPAGPPSAAAPATTTTTSSSPPPTYVPHPAGTPATRPPASSSSSTSSTTTSTTPPAVTTPQATTTSSTTSSSTTSSTSAPTTTTPTTTTPPTTPPTTTPPTTTPPTTQPPPTPPPQRPSRSASGQHEVKTGDNLWTIARDRLALVTGRRASDLSDHQIATYWLRVIDANRSRLRSHDPNLIFPGEVIHLPPVGG